jgi:hypothetical protein
MGKTADRAIGELEQEFREARRLEEVYNARLKPKKRPPAKDPMSKILEDFSGFAKSISNRDQGKTSQTNDDQGQG